MPQAAITRFAPSPTGYLHPGHLWSLMAAQRLAEEVNARFLLRIEDIDHTRCKAIYHQAILEDLDWLGFRFDGDIRQQSQHLAAYKAAAEQLREAGLIYPCFCTRKAVDARAAEEYELAGRAPHGPLGVIYPGTCRNLSQRERTQRIEAGEHHSWRLNIAAALAQHPLPDSSPKSWPKSWHDEQFGDQQIHWDQLGDVILLRRDIGTSYHLSAVVDDGLQAITHISRGRDLMHATPIHMLLQRALGLPTPHYRHHSLLLDDGMRAMTKRRGAKSIRELQAEGWDTEQLFEYVNRQPKG